jgi:hypothetical protein
MDLILVDVPKDLLVPSILEPINSILVWNIYEKSYLDPVFEFAEECLQDDSAIIVIHPHVIAIKEIVMGYCDAYRFKTQKEWLCMNRLHLCSPTNTTLMI